MDKVILDEATRQKLAGANGSPVPLCDAAGNVVGYYVSPERMETLRLSREAFDAWVDQMFPPETIARSKNDPRPRRTMDEVLKLVEGD